MMTNEEKFREVYTRRLTAAVQANPIDYWMAGATPEIVADRMIEAIKRNSFNASPTIRASAKELGVTPQTMKNIHEYVVGKLEVINNES